MKSRNVVCLLMVVFGLWARTLFAEDTLAPLKDGRAPQSVEALWADFDPRVEPLDIEILKQWKEDDVIMQVLRYRVGVFKGQKAMMAAVYGYPWQLIASRLKTGSGLALQGLSLCNQKR